MGDWTALDWSQGVIAIGIFALFVWVVKKVVGYFFGKGGALQRESEARISYMQTSENIQSRMADTLDRHDQGERKRSEAACDCLEEIRDQNHRIIDAGIQACQAAKLAAERAELPAELVEGVERVREALAKRNGG